MLGKVAFRNAKRSVRDYGIYMITVTIAFALIYAFNMLIYSEDIQALSASMNAMPMAIGMVSAVVVLAVGWLVSYMTKFMFQKRGRELGTYMMLGISNRVIARMFLLEQVLMGALAALCGFILGNVVYQVLVSIIMNIFSAPYEIRLSFSVQALVLTGVYIAVIYLAALFLTGKRLRKMKICDLLYADKKNETAAIGRTRGHWILLLVSLAVGAYGCVTLYTAFSSGANNAGKVTMTAIACMIVSLYGCYLFLAAFLSRLFLRSEKRKYKKDRLFLFRCLTAKMNTMSVTLGTLAMLITLTLAAAQSALLFSGFFEIQSAVSAGFDVLITDGTQKAREGKADFTEYEAYLEENLGINMKREYALYRTGDHTIHDWIEAREPQMAVHWFESDLAMAYSDYMALTFMQGYEPVVLEEDSYLVSCMGSIKACIGSSEIPLELGGKTLSLQECRQENFAQNGINGYYYFLVLPDEAVRNFEVEQVVFAADTDRETTEGDYDRLEAMAEADSEDAYHTVWAEVKGKTLADQDSFFTVFSFALFYLALIFSCVVATILVVQQLSEAASYKFRYRVLSNLGMTERRIDRLIFRQMAFYFGVPLVIPVFLSAFITFCINELCRNFVGTVLLLPSIFGALGMFLLVYLLYFAAAYISYRKNVLE